jgi:hypothetical protein
VTLNDYLQFALCAASIWRQSWLAVSFSFLYLLHMAADPYLSDPAYYIVLILIDSAVAMAISAYTTSRQDLVVAACAGLFLIVNCFGFGLWFIGAEPAPYDYACSVVYGMMIASVIGTRRPAHERMQRDDGRLGCSGAWFAVREGLGLHYKEGGSK